MLSITVLSGNEARLNKDDKELLKRFNENARRMGIDPAPALFLYGSEDDDGSANALSGRVNGNWAGMVDGRYAVGISKILKRALEAGTGGDLTNSPLERMVAVAAHEEGHIKRKDSEPHARGREPGLGSIKAELASDKEAVHATCNPQAMEEELKLAYLADARAQGITVEQLVLSEEQDTSDRTHPLLPTRIAHLEYLKAHPSRNCKIK